MKKIIIMILISIGCIVFAGEYPDWPIEKVISEAEQTKIGLAKLTSEERDELRILIIERCVDSFEKGREAGFEQATKRMTEQLTTPEVIESQIDGEFEGWEGETIVKLMNGQIWEQLEYYYIYHYAYMPEVLVYKSGSIYKMRVEGVDRSVGVIRLK